MSASAPIRLRLTVPEARALAEWLELAVIIHRADWNGERAVKLGRIAGVERRLRDELAGQLSLEVDGVGHGPAPAEGKPHGSKVAK